MVGQNGIGTDIHGENTGQCQQLIDDPLAVMFEVLSGDRIPAAEKGSAYTVGDTAVIRGGVQGHQCFSWLGHDSLLGYSG